MGGAGQGTCQFCCCSAGAAVLLARRLRKCICCNGYTMNRMKAFVLVAVLAAPLAQTATAARWLDNLPADDPDVVIRRNTQQQAKPQPVPAPPPSSGIAGSIVGAAGGAV